MGTIRPGYAGTGSYEGGEAGRNQSTAAPQRGARFYR